MFVRSLGEEDGVRLLGPENAFRSGLHAAHDIHIHRPLVPGVVVATRCSPYGVTARPTGTAVVLKTETRDVSGVLPNEQYMTLFIRGLTAVPSAGSPPPAYAPNEPASESLALPVVSHAIARDQTQRYARASGDYTRLHVDAAAATAAGFPDVIVHGLCTLA